MQPRIEITGEKLLAGHCTQISYAGNRTTQLWQAFMPVRGSIKNTIGSFLFSAEVYPAGFFEKFDVNAPFQKWAAVEVSTFDNLPGSFQTLVIPPGLYAVFIYRGHPAQAAAFYSQVFGVWLPQAGYVTDARPHMAVMGEKYRNNHPDSEEEIWIPVKPAVR